jgi:NAD(P)-dependent dehydrogenase (short-subunit alcohol dehydrogenase family)
VISPEAKIPYADFVIEAWIAITLTGTYLGMRALASSMRKAGGGAIVISPRAPG